ncbi:ABC-three component system middle component 6 [Sporosarcina limicola]|uniref:Uncharacterized protein n=1 Tax=Sporosarcina limicola TaxID=34101 RepID=A0A927MQE3_9BACL|nr:ABC-three component system middle component 6 [Sporosarcina limicola]MBE1555446.1 hypothetical protein [Sporosarcina limicola]
MFLPGKYVHQERTLVTIGAKIIYLFQRPQSVSKLSNSYKQLQEDEQLPVVSFDVFINALCFLYAINHTLEELYGTNHGTRFSVGLNEKSGLGVSFELYREVH